MSKYPEFRFSYSRPGFLTWKIPSCLIQKDKMEIQSVFMRYCGVSLGKITGDDFAKNAVQFWNRIGERKFDRLHVFPKDKATPGESGYEPGLTEESRRIFKTIVSHAPEFFQNKPRFSFPEIEASKGDTVMDCLIAAPGEWWIGYHQAVDWRSSFPGGLLTLSMPSDAVSRAFLKFEEGLRWSGFPIQTGSRCADIGSAPGGGAQALLCRGAEVLGVDPAEMSPVLMKHPRFTHLRGRINQLKRRYFRKSRWITTDMNVSPNYTLDVLEDLVLHPEIRIRGMLFTLKLLKWELFADIPDYIDRIRNWGFNDIKVNQLQFNRQEVMLAAIKNPFHR
ncbi:MAG: hypothetical protein LBQ54_04120 [Planctomycetaceae bacterium]|nr:hypothetical protein [Planctomycetaceae bacterium]